MTTTTVQRCEQCGRHKPLEDFARGSEVCRTCGKVEASAANYQRVGSLPEPSLTTVRRGPRASAPLRALAERGAAVFHRCDGADVHPKHQAAHKKGFWTEGHRVIEFIEAYCVYPEGPQQYQPAVVMAKWREMLFEMYRLREDGRRQYLRALIGVPKKSAKTTTAGWLALYHTVAEGEPSPKNVCSAANDDQADLVFEAARETAEHGDTARDASGELNLKTLTETWDREILVPSRPGAVLRRVASGGGNLDGPNLYFRSLDELHEWTTAKNQATYQVLSQGGALRRQPLLLMITTAGWDTETLCYRLYEHGKQVEEHPELDPTFFFCWWEAPAGADYRSREAWEAANPAAGITVTYERYLEDLNDPEMSEAVARRYRLNQWTDSEDVWLPRPWSEYKAPQVIVVQPSVRGSRRVVAAIDASTKYDSTAITWWQADGTGAELRVKARSRVWERPINTATGQPVEGWSVPFIEVKTHLYSMHFGSASGAWTVDGLCACGCGEAFAPLGLEAIGFDPSRITLMTEEWRADGLPMVEIPQTDARMVPGFQSWFQLLDDGRYEHDGSEALDRHVRNSVVKWAASGGRRLDRKAGYNRKPNDAAVAQVMAAYLLQQPAPHVMELQLW